MVPRPRLGWSIVFASASLAGADAVTIGVDLPAPGAGSYRLIGQSAMILTTSSGMSTGGQLDGVTSPGATIQYTEVFPPPTLNDYHDFGYFGRLETLDGSGNVADVSLVMAFRPGSGVGQLIGDVFSGQDEATLVAAFDTFDSPEFLNMLGLVSNEPRTLGTVAVPPIGRPGDTLDLVAFTVGPNGDVGAKVGSLTFSVVPAPATLGVLALGLLGCRRRR